MHAARSTLERRIVLLFAAALLLGSFGVPSPSAEAAGLFVTRADDPIPDGCETNGCSLREAVMAANASSGDDVILLGPETYTLSLTDPFYFLDVTDTTGDLTILGEGAGATIITKELFASGFFRVTSGAEFRLEGLSIAGTGEDGAISVGVWNVDGVAFIVDTVLTDHKSAKGSGVWNDSGATFVTGTTISGGTSGLGGAVYNADGLVDISGSNLTGNVATEGGGVYNDQGTTTVTATTIDDNIAGFRGGGIHNNAGFVTVVDTVISGSFPAPEGGGIYNSGVMSIDGGVISGNNSDVGGGIFSTVSLEVQGTTITGNTSSLAGGGLYNRGTATLDAVTVAGNVSATDGGGVFNVGNLQVLATTVEGNSAAEAGGGILNFDTLGVQASTVSGNHADFGAGVSHYGASLAVLNSTFSGNIADGLGGGLHLGSGSADIESATITSNAAAFGGGISSTISAQMGATVVAENSSSNGSPDCWGTLDSHGYNLLGSNEGCVFAPDPGGTDLIGTFETPIDPLLGTLADNGGPTFTHHPLGGSPVLDAIPVDDCSSAVDQRGVSRPQQGACDIGSVESANSAPVANAGPDQVAEATFGGTALTLDGTASLDPDGDGLDYEWTGGFEGGTAAGANPTVTFADLGTYVVTLTVSDGLATGVDAVQVVIQDTTLPEVTAALLPAGNVGPNEGTFEVDYSCTDSFDDSPTATAVLNDVVVEDGEIVKLKRNRKFQVKTIKNGQQFLLGPQFELIVTCTDGSGNEAEASELLVF